MINVRGEKKPPSYTVEMNISELCSPEDSDALAKGADAADEEEQDLGKHAASDQNIVAQGRKLCLFCSHICGPYLFMQNSLWILKSTTDVADVG